MIKAHPAYRYAQKVLKGEVKAPKYVILQCAEFIQVANGKSRKYIILDKTPAYIATSIETRGEDEILVEYRADVMVGDEGVDYARQTERKVEEETHTITGSDESMMFVASKTVEIYKMKRRMRE